MINSTHTLTFATLVTLSRILLTPIIVYCMLYEWWSSAFALFIIAASTDVLDGFLARYLDQKTVLGACLDPVADKIFLFSIFYTLFCVKSVVFTIPGRFLILLLVKEGLQIIGALVLYWRCGFVAIEANMFGKVTTVLHIVFVVWLFSCYFMGNVPSAMVYNFFLGMMSILMGISFVQYGYIWVCRLKNRGL